MKTINPKKSRKRKFVTWFHNHVDRRDDEWASCFAHSATEAASINTKKCDLNRFSIGHTWNVKTFREIHGEGFPV